MNLGEFDVYIVSTVLIATRVEGELAYELIFSSHKVYKYCFGYVDYY